MRKIIGDKWNPGANFPFDPLAVKEAIKMNLKVAFVCGTNLAEVKKAIEDESFQGTVVAD
jgi:uridylate kinase